jgi:WXG100 family type VII secretion target
MKGGNIVKSIIHMSADEIDQFISQLNSVKAHHNQSIQTMRTLINNLSSGYQAESARAYEECFTSMSVAFAKYSELLEDYSRTLSLIKQKTFTSDQQHAQEILSRYKV